MFGFSSVRYHEDMPAQHTPRPSHRKVRFPNRIREYRLKAGLTQRKLGEAVGRGRDAISSWERGICQPPLAKAQQLARYLCTQTDSLYVEMYIAFPTGGEASSRQSA